MIPVTLAPGDPRWRLLVDSADGSLPYHLPEWASLIGEAYRLRVFVLALEQAGGALAAGMPLVQVARPLRGRRWVSLPYTDYTPPLAADDAAREALVLALRAARAEQGVERVEVRASLDSPAAFPVAAGYRHSLALGGDPDEIFRTFHRTRVQQVVKKAARSGVSVREADGGDDEGMRTFFAIHAETRRRLGMPVQPWSFFRLLRERILARGLGRLLLARVEGVDVAAVVLLASRGTTVYKYSASLGAYSSHRPTHALLWEAIRSACLAGDRLFDFGRTDLGHEGLRAFKLGWGTTEHELVYTVFADRPPEAAVSGPSPALRAVLRRSPTAVSRAIGALLYRYAA